MLVYIVRRCLNMIPVMLLISAVGFVIIQLPPGDFLTLYRQNLLTQGDPAAEAEVARLAARYHLDAPLWQQYLGWMQGFLVGDFGESFVHRRPVRELLGESMALTVILSLAALLFSWLVALPVGIISAVLRNSAVDRALNVISVIGLSVPNFLLALILLLVSVFVWDVSAVGLFSPEYADAPWSAAKVLDLLTHLWIPMVVIGSSDAASLARVMRANLLDHLHSPHVTVARAKGLRHAVVIFKHAVPLAVNPLVSQLGMTLPSLISGSVLVSIVLGLPTAGTLFHEATLYQDMYLAGTFLLFTSLLLLVGNLLADIVLVLLDPRTRYT